MHFYSYFTSLIFLSPPNANQHVTKRIEYKDIAFYYNLKKIIFCRKQSTHLYCYFHFAYLRPLFRKNALNVLKLYPGHKKGNSWKSTLCKLPNIKGSIKALLSQIGKTFQAGIMGWRNLPSSVFFGAEYNNLIKM